MESSKTNPYSGKIQNIFKDSIYGTDKLSLEQAVGFMLKKMKYRLAVAESCTGGLVCATLVSVPGSSDYFCGGIVAYSNQAKVKLLNIPCSLITRYGAVSIAVAKAMARGAAGVFSAQCGLGITGVAGPGGGTREKPVGTVCIACTCGKQIHALQYRFSGNRQIIRKSAATAALFQICTLLKKKL